MNILSKPVFAGIESLNGAKDTADRQDDHRTRYSDAPKALSTPCKENQLQSKVCLKVENDTVMLEVQKEGIMPDARYIFE